MILIHRLLGFPLRNVCGRQPVNHNQITSRRFSSCKQKLTLHSPLSAEIQHPSPRRLSPAVTAENSIFLYQHRSKTQLPHSLGKKPLFSFRQRGSLMKILSLEAFSLKLLAFIIMKWTTVSKVVQHKEIRCLCSQNNSWAYKTWCLLVYWEKKI